MSLLDNHVWKAMLEKFHKLQRKPKTIREMKVELQLVLEDLPYMYRNPTKRLYKETQNMSGPYWWWTSSTHVVKHC